MAKTLHFLLKTMIIPISGKAIQLDKRLPGGRKIIFHGGAHANDGASYEFRRPRDMATELIFRLIIMISLPGIRMSKNSLAYVAQKINIEAMPDGEYLPPFDFNCAESAIQKISDSLS